MCRPHRTETSSPRLKVAAPTTVIPAAMPHPPPTHPVANPPEKKDLHHGLGSTKTNTLLPAQPPTAASNVGSSGSSQPLYVRCNLCGTIHRKQYLLCPAVCRRINEANQPLKLLLRLPPQQSNVPIAFEVMPNPKYSFVEVLRILSSCHSEEEKLSRMSKVWEEEKMQYGQTKVSADDSF